MKQRCSLLILPVAALFVAACSAPVKVKEVVPPTPSGVTTKTSIPGLLRQIQGYESAVARGDAAATVRYNHLVARLIQAVDAAHIHPWSAPVTVSDEQGSYLLSARAPEGVSTGHGQLTPTDALRMKGEFGEVQVAAHGIGAPLVSARGFSEIGHTQIRKNVPVRNVTAIVRFRDAKRAEIELLDPLQTETVALRGKSLDLAANYGAAMQVSLAKSRIDQLGFKRLLHPSRYDNTANLNFLQPYDPDRIPLLLVHGLDSTPATFGPLYLSLINDPEIRRHYQFWVFSYPSGYPYHYSASLLRRELDEINREYPRHKGIVIMGHSMGGVISKLMLTNAGDKLWVKAFGKTPAETKWNGSSRQLLEDTLLFEDRKEIDRAVFFSAPHRGSEVAVNPVVRMFSSLVKMPGTLADARNAALSILTADQAGLLLQSTPNSIGTLSPKNPFVLAVNEIPPTSRVPHHTVVGDRNKGDSPHSSDGVVPYWSAHLPTAASEKIVPSGHGSHAHPEGIEEARRILKLHLRGR